MTDGRATVGSSPSEATLTLHEVADILGVHYMTAYRYVRQGRLPAAKRGSQWVVDRDALDEFRAGEQPRAADGRRLAPGAWAARLEAGLLAGDVNGAWETALSAMNSGKNPDEFHMEVLVPAMESIGDLWAAGEITVGDEHRASVVAMRLIGRMSPRFSRRGRKRGTVVLATPPLDLHSLPVAIVGDLVRHAGFDVVDLGCDVPVDSLAKAIRDQDGLRAVGIGATTRENDAQTRAAVAAAREACADSGARILLGGSASRDAEHAADLGADEWAADGYEFVELVSF